MDQNLEAKELEIRERELDLRVKQLAQEKQKTIWWSAPLIIAVIGGVLGLAANCATEYVKAQHAREEHMLQAALDLVKQARAPGNGVEQTRSFIQFVIDIELGPADLRKKLQDHLNKDRPLPTAPPSAGVEATNTQPSSASRQLPSSDQPAKQDETGWFYLGKTDKNIQKWVTSSAIGTFEILPLDGKSDCPDVPATVKGTPVSVDEPVAEPWEGKVIRSLGWKYLREGGQPGERVRSRVKRTMEPGTVLKVLSLDSAGRDEGLPVLWAEVKVCGRTGA